MSKVITSNYQGTIFRISLKRKTRPYRSRFNICPSFKAMYPKIEMNKLYEFNLPEIKNHIKIILKWQFPSVEVEYFSSLLINDK